MKISKIHKGDNFSGKEYAYLIGQEVEGIKELSPKGKGFYSGWVKLKGDTDFHYFFYAVKFNVSKAKLMDWIFIQNL